jgi:hypothetical protein
MPSTILAAAVIAAGAPWLAGSAVAAPLSGSLALKNSAATSVETVQFRRHGGHWRGGRWIGPAVGAAAGFAIGSALAAPYYGGYYDNYAYSPGYDAYAYSPGVRARSRSGIRHRADPSAYNYGDPDYWSAYPSWQR